MFCKRFIYGRVVLLKKYGNWALVTGSSSGIGEAFAKNLAREGFSLILVSNDIKNLERVKAEIDESVSGIIVKVFERDFSRVENVKEFLEKPLLFKNVRFVVNAAGVGCAGAFESFGIDRYINLLNVNATSPMIFSTFFANKFLAEKERGAIINISTANTDILLPTPFSSVYTPTKMFLRFFSESISFELKRKNVDVLNVSCGPTLTNFQAGIETRVLPWSETPDDVVIKSLNALGKKSSITTNFVSKFLLSSFRILPLTRNFKVRVCGFYFGTVLGKMDRKNTWISYKTA